MCLNGGPKGKSEREDLENALRRTNAIAKEWCSDGKLIIEAARKHLATLPKPQTIYAVQGAGGVHAITGCSLEYRLWRAADLPHARLLATQFLESGYTKVEIQEATA
jgi:hypothetical protein